MCSTRGFFRSLPLRCRYFRLAHTGTIEGPPLLCVVSNIAACYDRGIVYLFLAEMFSERRGFLNQESSENWLFFCMILAVYLGHRG